MVKKSMDLYASQNLQILLTHLSKCCTMCVSPGTGVWQLVWTSAVFLHFLVFILWFPCTCAIDITFFLSLCISSVFFFFFKVWLILLFKTLHSKLSKEIAMCMRVRKIMQAQWKTILMRIPFLLCMFPFTENLALLRKFCLVETKQTEKKTKNVEIWQEKKIPS